MPTITAQQRIRQKWRGCDGALSRFNWNVTLWTKNYLSWCPGLPPSITQCIVGIKRFFIAIAQPFIWQGSCWQRNNCPAVASLVFHTKDKDAIGRWHGWRLKQKSDSHRLYIYICGLINRLKWAMGRVANIRKNVKFMTFINKQGKLRLADHQASARNLI